MATSLALAASTEWVSIAVVNLGKQTTVLSRLYDMFPSSSWSTQQRSHSFCRRSYCGDILCTVPNRQGM